MQDIQNPNPKSESSVQMLLKLHQLRAVLNQHPDALHLWKLTRLTESLPGKVALVVLLEHRS